MDGWQIGKSYWLRTTLSLLVMTVVLSGCRSTTSPEEVTDKVANFAGDVLYNSAGSASQGDREAKYPQPCHHCNGLGYHDANEGAAAPRTACHTCQGRGWN